MSRMQVSAYRKSMKTIEEKMATPAKPEVKHVNHRNGSNFPAGKMLIPTPKLIDEVIRKIPKGEIRTIEEIRDQLAKRFHADFTCPLTTGIFIRIVAENAEHQHKLGKKDITPYWRVVQKDGSFNPKLPGGPVAQARKLRAEGFEVLQTKTKKLKVIMEP